MTAQELCAHVRAVFADAPRPEHHTNYEHCEECREHDDLMRSRELDTLELADVDNPGWNPVCFLSAEAFRYWFPAFARLCCLPPAEELSYLPEFLFFLGPVEGDSSGVSRQTALFSPTHRRAVLTFLRWNAEHMAGLLEGTCYQQNLADALAFWEAAVGEGVVHA